MNNIVASEGAAKTTMCALLLGAVLNIGLDPIFIYTLDMGVFILFRQSCGKDKMTGFHVPVPVIHGYS